MGAAFHVLDDKELWVYLRRRIRELKLKYFVRAANVSQFLDSLLDFMRRCQDELVGPEEYAEYVGRLERGEIPLPRVAKFEKAGGFGRRRKFWTAAGKLRGHLRRWRECCARRTSGRSGT